MNKNTPLISVVCLTWNSKRDILDLLSSIYRANYPKNNLEVIVVDNASTDKTVDSISTKYPKVKLIKLHQNLGMPAFNLGYRIANGKYIVSIQSDVTISKDLFKKCIRALEQDSSIGLMGVKVLDKKTGDIHPPTIKINFYTGTVHHTENKDFDYLEGLVLVFKKAILEKVGYLSQRYFFYGDDPDFSIRVKQAGFKLKYFPETHVYHGKSVETPTYFSKKYHHFYKATLSLVYAYGNFFQKISATLFQLLLIPLFLLVTQKRNTFGERWWGFAWNLSHIRRNSWIFFGFIVCGIFLRVAAIVRNNFWFDEVFTYRIARLPIEQIVPAVLTDNNPPLYYLIMHFVQKISMHEIVLRLPSLLFNVLTLLIMNKFLRQFKNKSVAQFASQFFLVSPLSIYLASTARLHALGLLLATAAVYTFVKFINKTSRLNIIVFTLICVAGLYTHYYFLLLLAPFSLLIWNSKSESLRKKWIVIIVILLTTFVPWVFLALSTVHNNCSCPHSFLSLPATLVSPMLGGIGEVSLRRFVELPMIYSIFYAAVGIVAFIFFVKGFAQEKFLSLLYGLPLALLTIAGLMIPIFSPKGFSIFSPIFIGLVAIGISRKSRVLLLPLLVLLVSVSQFVNPFFRGTEIKPLLSILQTQNEIIAHVSSITYYPATYYLPKTEQVLLTTNPYPVSTQKYIGGATSSILDSGNSLIVIDTSDWVLASERVEVLKKIDELFYKQVLFQHKNITAYKLKKL